MGLQKEKRIKWGGGDLQSKACRFTQRGVIDYKETFLPVAMLKSIRIFLSIAICLDYEIWQMDVKTAFLNGNLEEDNYM